jgi:hypothetical protein
MYTEYKNNPDYGDVGHDNSLAFSAISSYDTPMTSDKQFTVVIQAKDQGSNL